MPADQIAGGAASTRAVGRCEVIALLDAAGPWLRWEDAFEGATPEDWDRARHVDPDAFGEDGRWHLTYRCFAVRRPGGQVILVDAGVGPAGSPASTMAPVPGHLPDRLAEAGIDARAVEALVLTHVHADHYGWATPAMFPNADYVVQRQELAAVGADSPAWSYFLDPLGQEDRLRVVDGSVRLAQSMITAIPTPGHTPGHQSVVVSDGNQELIVTRDVLVHAVQLVDPGVAYTRPEVRPRRARTLLSTGAVLRTAGHAVFTCHAKNSPLRTPPNGLESSRWMSCAGSRCARSCSPTSS